MLADTGPPLDGGLGALSQVAPQGALSAAQPPDPFAAAEEKLRALTTEVAPLDSLRALGAAMIPDAASLAAERQERRASLQRMIDAYLQRGAAPIADPLARLLSSMAQSPRSAGVAAAMGAGAAGAESANEQNRSMAAAREAAAAKAEVEGLNQLADDRRADMQTGANLMVAGQPQRPKQFSALVNEVLERRNQVFDKLIKLGVDASTPESAAAIEARIDREVAPMVKALYADYPNYRDMIVAAMPQMFATYSGGKPGEVVKPVTPAVRGAGGGAGPALTMPARPGAAAGSAGNPVVPADVASSQVPGIQSPFADFITAPVPRRTVDGMTIRDKAAEQAQQANAKEASKYYNDMVRPGADTASNMINVVGQLRAIGPNTGKLAPIKQQVGNWMNELHIPNAFGLVDEAIKNNNADMLLQQMVQAILQQARGVQTEGDAIRAFKQAAQLTDPNESWDYKLRAMEATAWRLRYRQQLYQDYGKTRAGNYDGADAAFTRFEERTPFVQQLPTRAGGKKAVFFNEFVNARQRSGATLADALKEWTSVAGQGGP